MDVLSGRGRVCGCGKRGLEREREKERERKEVNVTNWEIPNFDDLLTYLLTDIKILSDAQLNT